MEQNEFKNQVKLIYRYMILTMVLIALVLIGILYFSVQPSGSIEKAPKELIVTTEIPDTDIKDGVHIPTGFKSGEGLPLVIENCTACHSSKLVTQNRATKEGWTGMIRWMQQTQNLWDLGENEEIIVNYLATYYAPEQKGRRENLANIEWYALEE